MLVRFTTSGPPGDPAAGGDRPRLGLVRDGQLYDLSQAGDARFQSLEALLTAADPVEDVLQQVRAAAHALKPVCPATELLKGGSQPYPGGEVRLLPPIDRQEVWAAGVTYKKSEEARKAESKGAAAFYELVYEAERPELFFKATPHRVVGMGGPVGIRRDSDWNVPEPELGLVLTRSLSLLGYTIGNDMSSRAIEGENPLYLPQAKVYTNACALGPGIVLADEIDAEALPIQLRIERDGEVVFQEESSTARMKRSGAELIEYLGRANTFPAGVILLTGTGIVPDDTFTLREGDVVTIRIEGLGALVNTVETVG